MGVYSFRGREDREDRQTGLTHVCQTSLCDTRDELDTVDVDSLTEAFTEDVQDTDDFYQRVVPPVKRLLVIRTMVPLRTMMDILV